VLLVDGRRCKGWETHLREHEEHVNGGNNLWKRWMSLGRLRNGKREGRGSSEEGENDGKRTLTVMNMKYAADVNKQLAAGKVRMEGRLTLKKVKTANSGEQCGEVQVER
jgi:hypothetical protein